jgi:Phage-related lysozyme (muraminidase)
MANQENDNLHISPAGLDIIKEFEGWYPKAYKDPVGVWTIGWGTTGIDAQPGRVITKDQGTEFLRRDLLEVEDQIKAVVKVALNQYQFDALCSFVYNVGIGNLTKSTLLKLINRGQFDAAAGQFGLYNHARDRATGKYIVLPGLTRRRAEEAALFQHPVDVERISAADDSVYDLEDPNGHDANVQPETPRKINGAWSQVIKNSDTFKGLATTLTGIVTVLGTLLQPLAQNPVALAGVLVTFAGIGAVLFIKVRDTSQGR